MAESNFEVKDFWYNFSDEFNEFNDQFQEVTSQNANSVSVKSPLELENFSSDTIGHNLVLVLVPLFSIIGRALNWSKFLPDVIFTLLHLKKLIKSIDSAYFMLLVFIQIYELIENSQFLKTLSKSQKNSQVSENISYMI